MMSELVRAIYNSAGMDWQTAEKVAYTLLTYMEAKLPATEYEAVKRHLLGDPEYKLPDRTNYPGYYGELPDQARS